MKTKDEMNGFIKGVIAYFNILEKIKEEKYFNFTLLEGPECWLLDFGWFLVDIPSSNADPRDDNSITKMELVNLKIEKDISDKELAQLISDVCDEALSSDLTTERSEYDN